MERHESCSPGCWRNWYQEHPNSQDKLTSLEEKREKNHSQVIFPITDIVLESLSGFCQCIKKPHETLTEAREAVCDSSI